MYIKLKLPELRRRRKLKRVSTFIKALHLNVTGSSFLIKRRMVKTVFVHGIFTAYVHRGLCVSLAFVDYILCRYRIFFYGPVVLSEEPLYSNPSL